jgi:hypothetical protein
VERLQELGLELSRAKRIPVSEPLSLSARVPGPSEAEGEPYFDHQLAASSQLTSGALGATGYFTV